MLRLRWWVLLFVLSLVAAPAAFAQEPASSPLLAVLASVPDEPFARGTLSYVDYSALNGGPTTEAAWLNGLGQRVFSGPQLANLFVQTDTQESLIGVSVYDVGQAATWGQPPEQVTLLQGTFNPEAIVAAYAARDYSAKALGDLTLYCGPDGCEAGSTLNLRARNMGDPFGGELGRQQPVLFVPQAEGSGQLISSPGLEAVVRSADVATTDSPSLAESPEYQAAARTVTTEGPLLQAYFLNDAAFGPAPDGGDALPPYLLAMIAETEAEGSPVASVSLIFSSLAEAESALALVESRIESLALERTEEPFSATLKDRGVLLETSAAEDAESGLGVAQFTFRAPDGENSAYGLLVQTWIRMEMGWLAAG